MQTFALLALAPVLVGSLTAAPVPKTTPVDWKSALKERKFDFDRAQKAWSDDLAAAMKAGLEVEIPTGQDLFKPRLFTFSRNDGPKFSVAGRGQSQGPFMVRGDALYFADFHPRSSGCELLAYDLTTGKQVWTKQLEGLGPIRHSKYRNRVTMSVECHPDAKDAFALVITGDESAGGYIEVIDLATGKQLANKKFGAEILERK